MNNPAKRYAILVLVLLGFALRFWGLGTVSYYSGDQVILVPATENYMKYGFFRPDDWVHPPSKYFLLYGSMKIFGNNVYGWQMKNVIMGSLSIFILFLLGKELLGDRRAAFIAASMLAVEPLHIAYSRSVLGEISSIFFFLIAVYVLVRFVNGKEKALPSAGIFLGLAIASKWYYLLPALVMLVFYLICSYKERGWRWTGFVHAVSTLLLLPLAIYMLPFYQWMKKGYTLYEFVQMQFDAYRILQTQTTDTFVSEFFRASPSSPWEWFVRPIVYGRQTAGHSVWGQFEMFLNNPPIWLLTFPALAFIAYMAFKTKNRNLFFIFIMFVAMYAQFVFVERAIFLYSAIIVLPFVYLAVSYFLMAGIDRITDKAIGYKMLWVGVILWGIYLYPLAIGIPAPVILYKPFFYLGKVLTW